MEKYTLKSIRSVTCGRVNDTRNVQLVSSQSSDQSRSCNTQEFIPVVDSHNNPLIPCKIYTAKKLVKSNKAIPFYKKGFFCIKLRKVVEKINKLKTVFAIDPGSKRNGYTVANEKGVILNIQSNTNNWAKKNIENRKNNRRSRRNRKTPYRKCRPNRNSKNNVPPSTKSRWDCHIRIMDVISQIIPIDLVVIEDIKAETKKNCRKWNKNFSPLEVGKKYFEQEIHNRNLEFESFEGWKTYWQRCNRNFTKNSNKLKEDWNTHCVDSHCLVELMLGDMEPNKNMYILNFLQHHRRELHKGCKNGKRKKYGSTRSLVLNRGTLVKHPKYGLTYVGGCNETRISLHDILTGERLSQNIKVEDCKILTKQSWRTAFLPGMNAGVSCRK